jgi:hypothetical protein
MDESGQIEAIPKDDVQASSRSDRLLAVGMVGLLLIQVILSAFIVNRIDQLDYAISQLDRRLQWDFVTVPGEADVPDYCGECIGR